MSNHIRLYGINFENDFDVLYKKSENLDSETSNFTLYDSFNSSTNTVIISGFTINFGDKYWVKLTDKVTNRYIIQNIRIHDECNYECYDATPTPTPTLTITPTPTPTLTITPTPTTTSATPTPTSTSATPTPTATVACIDIQSLDVISVFDYNMNYPKIEIRVVLESNVDVNTSILVFIVTTNYSSFYERVDIAANSKTGRIEKIIYDFPFEIAVESYCVSIINGSNRINCNGFQCKDVLCPCIESTPTPTPTSTPIPTTNFIIDNNSTNVKILSVTITKNTEEVDLVYVSGNTFIINAGGEGTYKTTEQSGMTDRTVNVYYGPHTAGQKIIIEDSSAQIQCYDLIGGSGTAVFNNVVISQDGPVKISVENSPC